MPYYAPSTLPPTAPGTRSRGSSNASRYVPEGYPPPPRSANNDSEAHLAPSRRKSSAPDVQLSTPSRSDHYRSSGEYRTSEQQLRPPGPDASLGFVPTPDGYVRPAYGTQYSRAGSVGSRHSVRSHGSHRSSRSHHSDGSRRRRSSRDSEREHDADAERRRERRRVEREGDDMDMKPIKRTNTKRPTLGGSLFSLWDNVKAAAKGY